MGLSVPNGQFHWDPQTLSITSAFGDEITGIFWRQAQRAGLGGQGRRGTDFPASATQVHEFEPIGVKLQCMVEAAGVDEPRLGTTEESCTYSSSELKAKKVEELLTTFSVKQVLQ